eukprot:CAMPEP_0197628808 /NCGR_PEP_ID=MMETSP1338-20131121/6949_1 /TAXON_ID=43686 ORGANISM="Pelagodinium beii, Strain RCC1491" /NCGR_SAMPLE_ID=MMETSP1338 /ASSEMBLY_ACC=CAM_ASM_000754 /LENGTH=73 /DNA_ID=CAMNT_0043199807 /DNA_START=301 /DNA_END=522 /DNA_ORIENTATION=-
MALAISVLTASASSCFRQDAELTHELLLADEALESPVPILDARPSLKKSRSFPVPFSEEAVDARLKLTPGLAA